MSLNACLHMATKQAKRRPTSEPKELGFGGLPANSRSPLIPVSTVTAVAKGLADDKT